MKYLIQILYLRRKTVATISWLVAGILIPLVLLTLIVLVLRVGNFAALGADTIFIIPNEPDFSIGDTNGAWSTDTQIDLFSLSHENEQGEVTILSGDGDTVIAPGSTGMYRFELKNPGNVALQCDLDLGAVFYASEGNGFFKFPFSLRLRDGDGNYLLGSETEWLPYHQLSDTTKTLTLGKNSFMTYELEWRWDFEGNNDLIDTYFGSIAAQKDLVLSLSIATTAQLAPDPEAQGGNVLDEQQEPLTGGVINPLPFILVAGGAIVCLAVVILIYVSSRNKLNRLGLLYRLSGSRRNR